MGIKYKVELEDVQGHAFRYKGEDLTGQEVAIRLQDGSEVQGHIYKREDLTGEEAEGHVYKRGEDLTGEDTEGHGLRYKGIELDVDDSQAHLLQTATDRGEPIYVRFPDGAEVKGHGFRIRS